MPPVGADGAIAAQDTYAEYSYDPDIYPLDSSGVSGGFTDGWNNTELYYYLSYFAFPGSDPATWAWNVTSVDYELWKNAGYGVDLETVVYENNGAGDAGTLYGSENKAYGNYPDGWVAQVMSPAVAVPLGEVGVYAGMAADRALAGLHGINYELDAQTYGGLQRSGAGFPNPMTGEVQFSDRAYAVRITVEASKEDSTTYNQYYGNATDYIARRDVNYTFPASSSSRQIRITVPLSESLRNITRSNGGLWDELLASGDYTFTTLNPTHDQITLPEATINSYGGDYRIYTQSHSYVYNLNGAFYENGTSAGSITVTVHTTTDSFTIDVDGEVTFGSDDKVVMLSWPLSGGGTRRVYTPFQTETITIFVPEDTYATYDFEIRDYTSKKLLGTPYLQANRIVNSTDYLIERMRIITGNAVPLTLVVGQTYTLLFLWADGTTTDWGYFVPSVDPTPVLILRGVSFLEQAYTVNQFITIGITRPTATTITVDYEDTRSRTDWANVSVRVRGGAVVQTYSSSSSSYTWNWNGVNASLGYIIAITGEHQDIGEWGYTKILDQDETFPDPPDLTEIFSFGGLDATSIIAYVLTLTTGLTSSVAYKRGGLLATMAMASFMSYLGWATWSYNLLALGWFFTLLVFLLMGRNK